MIYKLASLACAIALTFAHAPAAVAAKIKLVSAGPVTTYSLPFLVALKKGWLDGLEVEDLHVTGEEHGPELKALLPLIGRPRAAQRLVVAAS